MASLRSHVKTHCKEEDAFRVMYLYVNNLKRHFLSFSKSQKSFIWYWSRSLVCMCVTCGVSANLRI